MTNSIFVNTQGLYQRRRAFNLSYRNDFTMNLGELVPVYFQDLIPNTSWHVRTHGLIRFMPMVAPIMDNINLYIHFWQAPRRVLEGEEFTEMITGASEEWPGIWWTPKDVKDAIYALAYDDAAATANKVTAYLTTEGSIFDMFGYGTKLFSLAGATGKLNARKFIMYFRLLSNWYTNENVEPFEGFKEFVEPYDKHTLLEGFEDGNISADIAYGVFMFYKTFGTAGFCCHMWPKDYFTSALPTLQYGAPTYLPLAESAPVTVTPGIVNLADPGLVGDSPVVGPLGLAIPQSTPNASQPISAVNGGDSADITDLQGEFSVPSTSDFKLTADLSEATAVTINELRVANALQVFKEREMRYGRRAPEYYKGFYGVQPGDLRLQLPKFLGGGRIPIMISDIEQTSATAAGQTAQGTLAGKGTAIAAGFARASTFTAEEAVVIGLAWVMPDVTYAEVLSRHDTKINDRFDYYNPSFAHIGEQEVFLWELNTNYFGASNTEFGYQPRYTEYRFHMNEMHGEFKSSLAYWTLGRLIDSYVNYNAEFIYMQPAALQRIFAVRETSDGFLFRNVLASLKFSCAVLQPLSRYGTPGLMP